MRAAGSPRVTVPVSPVVVEPDARHPDACSCGSEEILDVPEALTGVDAADLVDA